MEQVFLLYRAEKLKYRHSLSGRLWILFPCLTLLMAYGLAANYGTVDSYNWWYIGILPGFLTLYCCMSQEKEKKIRNQTVLLTAEDLKKAWDAKTLNAVKYVAAANVLLVSCSFLLGNIVMPLLQQEQVIYVPGYWNPAKRSYGTSGKYRLYSGDYGSGQPVYWKFHLPCAFCYPVGCNKSLV